MELIYIFINPKKALESVKDKVIIFKILPLYIILFTLLIFFIYRNLERTLFYGAVIQILFNIIFLIFISLFIKVFIKIFGVERKFIFALNDTLLIYIPSFVLFFIFIIIDFNSISKFSYALIQLFSYNQSEILKKALFFFYYPPRALLFLYTIIGLRFIYNLNLKRSIFITFLIYFIIFIVYLF